MLESEQVDHAPVTWQAFAKSYGLENRPVVAIGFYPHWRGILASFVQGVKIQHTNDLRKVPQGAVVLVWGKRAIGELPEDCQIVRLEDGFLRSVGLGAEFARPLSWVLDFNHLYFDATGPSRLESLLNSREFTAQERERARKLLCTIQESGITKYNTGECYWRRPEGEEKVILVPGQVESDASIQLGSPDIQRNIALLKKVKECNANAWIIYKPHPDVLAGARKEGKGEENAHYWCNEVITNVNMAVILDQVDEVHTMTSLAGFEALLRNKPVTCYGLPFFAGWGLTTDKIACDRRKSGLKLLDLVHAVLIDYPVYVSRQTGQYVSPEQVLGELEQWRGTPLSWQDQLKKKARKLINMVREKT